MRVVKAVHGGDLRSFAASSGRAADTILDFSANVNPLGPPPGVREELSRIAADPRELERYPDPHYHDARVAFAARHAVDPLRIVVANGTAALLGAIVRALAPQRCLLAVPAFSEYAKAARGAGARTIGVPLRARTYALDVDGLARAARDSDAKLCIVANPNNPTGALTARAEVVALERVLARTDCRLVVDEAFVDYVPDESCIGAADGAIVLRSLTKFFAIPGVRIGYAVAPASLAAAIADALPSWPVGAIETRLARAALGDGSYERTTRGANAAERERFAGALAELGFGVFASVANFLFLDVAPRRTTAANFARALLERHGIAVRTCDDYAGLPTQTFVRVAVRSRVDDDRLLAALADPGGF